MIILDFEWNVEACGFTIVFICFFYSVYTYVGRNTGANVSSINSIDLNHHPGDAYLKK